MRGAEGGQALESETSGPNLAQVAEDLGGDREASAAHLLEALIASGPTAVGDLRDLLEETEGPWTPAQKVLIERSLAALPGWVIEHSDPSTQASARDLAGVRIALELVAELEDEGALRVAVDLATPSTGNTPHALVLRLFQDTVRQRLVRTPREARALDDLLEEAHPRLVTAMIRAAGKAPSGETAAFLTRRLEEDSSFDLMLLAELGRITAALEVPCDPAVEFRVGLHLGSTDAALRREAALAAGRLALSELTPDLIELLGDGDPGVRANAAWALERLTGRSDPPDLARWRRWFASESDWWRTDAAQAFQHLREGSPYEVGAALRELAGHRLYRHESSEEITQVLSRDEPELVAQACAVLGTLRSGLAKEELIELLAHPEERLRMAAWQALKAITGREDLPLDPEAWAGI